jgi:adenine phosphoribosyltransferase
MRKESDKRDHLRQSFGWLGDRTDPDFPADVTGWWRSPDTLSSFGSGLAALFVDSTPTLVVGTESHGSLLGVLTAQHLGIVFAEVRKDPERAADCDAWWEPIPRRDEWCALDRRCVVVDGLGRTSLRRKLQVKSMLNIRER